jgi:hypothetical protein
MCYAARLAPEKRYGMLYDTGCAVFDGKECCVQVPKALMSLNFPLATPPYAADQNYYAATLRYKLS